MDDPYGAAAATRTAADSTAGAVGIDVATPAGTATAGTVIPTVIPSTIPSVGAGSANGAAALSPSASAAALALAGPSSATLGGSPAFGGATFPIARPSPSLPQPLPMIRLMGVELHAVSEKQAIDYILSELDAERGGAVVTPNLDHLRRYKADVHFAAVVCEAELVVADGMPLIWASKVAGCPLPQRVAGSDLILTLSAAAAAAGRSIYLLGGAPGTAEGAADVLRSRHPNIKIVGTACPPPGFESSEPEMAKVVADLVAARPDIVFVALGSPKQEYLIERIRNSLPQSWWLGVGVSFSFLTGHVQRAPRWLQKIGLEWVHRLVQEPRRLFKRYVVQGLPFAGMLFTHACAQRVRSWFSDEPLTFDGCYPRSHRAAMYAARLSASAATMQHAALAASRTVTPIDLSAPLADGTLAATGALASTGSLDIGAGSDRGTALSVRGSRDSQVSALSRLKAIVLLSGQLRPSPLMQAVERSCLDLPIAEDRTLLNHWLGDVVELAKFARVDGLPVRVLVSRTQDQPISRASRYQEILSIEKDASEYRGTGGVLSDITREYGDDDFILVANAAQLLLEPLSALATALDHKRSDIALVSHLDGTPGGLMLIRCATLRQINPIGFIDLKEQAMPNIARNFDVRVVHCRRPTGLPLRTTNDYITALRQWHRGPGRLPGSRRGQIDPMAEDFSRGFAIVEGGAWVDSSVYLHDAVVLRGAKVEPGVAAVRSLIGPRAVVKRETRLIDAYVNA